MNSRFSRFPALRELRVSKCSLGCNYCFRGRAECTDRTRIYNNEDTTHRHPPPPRILEARKHYSPRIETSTKSAEQPAGCGRDARMTSVGRGDRAQGVRPRFPSPGDTLRRTHGLRLTSRAGPARIVPAGGRGGLWGGEPRRPRVRSENISPKSEVRANSPPEWIGTKK